VLVRVVPRTSTVRRFRSEAVIEPLRETIAVILDLP
jgi:hypothetical protein